MKPETGGGGYKPTTGYDTTRTAAPAPAPAPTTTDTSMIRHDSM
jgi:hypothetical protein